MIPFASVTHRSPGRLRLKVPSVRGEEEWFLGTHAKLLTCPEVRGVEVNFHTASLLIHHDGEADAVLSWAQVRGLFEMEDAYQGPQLSVAATVRQGLNHFNRALGTASGGTLDINSLLFMTFSTAAIVQLLRGQYLGPATTLVEQALRSVFFIVSNPPE